MSPADRRFWQLAQRRVTGLQSDVAAALLRAYSIIRDNLTETQLVRLIESGNLERLLNEALNQELLDRAFIPLRQRLVRTAERGFQYAVPDLPKAGKVDGVLAVSFDHLSPRVIDAVRELDTRVITSLSDEVRDVVRAHVENGLRDGRAPKSVAREIKDVIGLSPRHAAAVENFRRSLEGEADAGSPLDRALRDKRFDAKIKRGELSAADIEKMTERYRQRMQAFNAEVVSRTAAMDSYKEGQRLAWVSAQENGVVPEGSTLVQTWVTVGDERVRPEHRRMNGETIPFGGTFSNGETVPGSSTYGCRCLARVKVVRAGRAAA